MTTSISIDQLREGDEIVNLNGHRYGATFVRVDARQPGFVRIVVSRKGVDYYDAIHPESRLQVAGRGGRIPVSHDPTPEQRAAEILDVAEREGTEAGRTAFGDHVRDILRF